MLAIKWDLQFLKFKNWEFSANNVTKLIKSLKSINRKKMLCIITLKTRKL